MIKKIPFLLLVCQLSVNAQEAIFTPTSNISSYGSVSSPSGENFSKIIDGDITTKFLDFNYSDGLGFTVNLNGVSKTATSMEFTTANDSPERDPMNYQILGSTNGSNYTVITSGTIVCYDLRYNTTTYNFTNAGSYAYYRLVFSNQCNTIESMIQIAEVQLFHTALNTSEFNKQMDFAVYPNPNNGIFSIRSSTNSAIDYVTVSDVLGKRVNQFQLNGTTTSELNLQGMASGIYFVQITSGSKSITKKIVIE